MNLLFPLAAAVIAACGLYMVLSRNAVRIVLGLSMLGTATNLVILVSGRTGGTTPPLIASGAATVAEGAAASLPQALVLTAIVIGFALTTLMAAVVLRARGVFGSIDTRDMVAGATGDGRDQVGRNQAAKDQAGAGGRRDA